MEIWQIPVVFTIGAIAGFINTLAGGGSLLTLPMLIFLGLPTAMANGTNRLAITVQSIFAVAGFRKKGISDFKSSLLLSIPVLIGSVVGAKLSMEVSDVLFKRILAVIMLFVLGLILWNPTRRKNRNIQSYENITSLSWTRRIIILTIFFFVGIYGGYIQAGIGLIIIAILTTLSGLNLVETNSHKVFVIGISAIVSLIVFIFYSKICWSIGLSLAAGNGLGGWIGSHCAVTKGERFIRLVLVICVVAMVVKLLY
ncbi:MAG TPA: sulfite exporter TauE/SafE family protein [Candidatus Wujingus californicus]|uniref:sulfite exporter TauE/SafE family protein n=1 Tax=Candidatus Wujingus californicus TaxID=3367618 RepID=UPI001D78BA74|nr:TSUP family transporter [Planctomycetota bacterium]MDO8131789.1 TSUP family transporter [Candidatus Brocadiales bacterium]